MYKDICSENLLAQICARKTSKIQYLVHNREAFTDLYHKYISNMSEKQRQHLI